MRSCYTNLNSEIFDKELSFLLEVIKSQNIKETHLEIRTTARGTDSCDREGYSELYAEVMSFGLHV